MQSKHMAPRWSIGFVIRISSISLKRPCDRYWSFLVNSLLRSRFYPNLGGIETVAGLLAHEWHRLGETVTVVSDVACSPVQRRGFPFAVHYRPSAARWLRLMRSADVFVHFNVSLRALWPLLVVPRPFIATHHGFYFVSRTGERDWRQRLKLRIAQRAAANIAVSQAVARVIGVSCDIIPNPFDPNLFHANSAALRSRELAFVGRLVSDKGVDLLFKSLGILNRRGLRPRLTVIGDGPERPLLEQLVQEMRLEGQVGFIGVKSQGEVANLLSVHRVLVIPSVVQEGFGVVALEGIASGCVVVGSEGGGLTEAIGPCGLTFPNGDASALAEKLELLLTNDPFVKELLTGAEAHLARHHPTLVAKRYLDVIKQAVA